MPIMAKESGGGSFIPAPAGAHTAVCCDVVDLGLLKVSFGGKEKEQHKIRIVWQIGEDMESGKPFTVGRRYTLSLHEKAALRKDLESWRGRSFNKEELSGFDVECLIGVPCLLNVIQETRDNSTYANVTSIMRLPKGMTALTVTSDYVRVCDRPADGQKADEPVHTIDDQDIPF